MGVARTVAPKLLVVLMAVGSLLMWLGVPIFWIWLASRLSSSTQPAASLVLLVMVGIGVSVVVLALVLGRLNRVHMALTDTLPRRRHQAAWLRSARGDRDRPREHGILATVMAVSVGLALSVMAVWFFFFASGGGLF